jgi:2-polyprenyl-3-methyl-5-hydroxy-6-metoxy-1,4-benzoquinol methylase
MPRVATQIERIAFRSLEDAKALCSGPVVLSKEDMTVPYQDMWRPEDAPILAATEEIISLLPYYNEDAVSDHNAKNLNQEFFTKYLRMTNVRVANAADALGKRLRPGANILEIGSFFGSFSLGLQRLGYKVTAVDRYDEYRGRFDKHVQLMEGSGVSVVRTKKETEYGLIEKLGQFDVVIAMAVIEHVPHTPRLFLEALCRATRPGGYVTIDTPNLARYWNRRYLSEGKTIFQSIQDQFECIPPWEGHHREYTGDELAWMLERVGCTDVQVKRFDYNMLQFSYIDRPHLECLEACINTPEMGDMILAIGRIPH